MWISQTYLGNFDVNSDVYLYYFWEDYGPEKEIPRVIQDGLSKLGYSFRERVSAFVPMREYLGHVRAEMEDKFRDFWWTFQGQTPGIFLTRKPLRDFDPTTGEWLYFPINRSVLTDSNKATAFFVDLHNKCREIIEHAQVAEKARQRDPSLLTALYESLNLKVTFMGAGIDFKPIISALNKKNKPAKHR